MSKSTEPVSDWEGKISFSAEMDIDVISETSFFIFGAQEFCLVVSIYLQCPLMGSVLYGQHLFTFFMQYVYPKRDIQHKRLHRFFIKFQNMFIPRETRADFVFGNI